MKQLIHAAKYGAIGGVVMTTSWWLSQFIFPHEEGEPYDFSQGEFLGYAAMILALTAVFIGVKRHRDKELGGAISFKGAFVMGLYIVLVASVIYVGGWMIYYPNFMPDFADQYAEYQMTQYKEAGLSTEEIALKQKEMNQWMEMYENPVVMAGITFMEMFPVGLIVAVISAFILKRKVQ